MGDLQGQKLVLPKNGDSRSKGGGACRQICVVILFFIGLVVFGFSPFDYLNTWKEINHLAGWEAKKEPDMSKIVFLRGGGDADMEKKVNERMQESSNSFAEDMNQYNFFLNQTGNFNTTSHFDSDLLNRLLGSTLQEDEAYLLEGKRLIVLGAGPGQNNFEEYFGCPLDSKQVSVQSLRPGMACSYSGEGPKVDALLIGRFEHYNFEIVQHRETLGEKGLKEEIPIEEYRALLQGSFGHLQDKHRDDFVVININPWVLTRDGNETESKSLKQNAIHHLTSVLKVARDFFNPKAIAFQAIPFKRRMGQDLAGWVNQIAREVAKKTKVSIFEVRNSKTVSRQFANINLNWVINVANAMNRTG